MTRQADMRDDGTGILGLDVIDLEKVVMLIQPELPGVTCYVEQTGGGCATIYLGDSYDCRDGLVGACWSRENPIGDYRPVMAGPGWFEGPAWTEGRADPSEFSIGYDQDQDDPAIDGWDIDGHDERVIARRMVQLYRDHPLVREGLVR